MYAVVIGKWGYGRECHYSEEFYTVCDTEYNAECKIKELKEKFFWYKDSRDYKIYIKKFNFGDTLF